MIIILVDHYTITLLLSYNGKEIICRPLKILYIFYFLCIYTFYKLLEKHILHKMCKIKKIVIVEL